MDKSNKIIVGMCTTARADWGLEKDPMHPWSSGMTELERDALYREMDQLYYHNVRPVLESMEKEMDGLVDEIEKLKAENAKLLVELRNEQDAVRRYQNNGNY